MLPTFDQVEGCFVGIAVGDALGAPVECMSSEKIASLFGRVTDLVPFDHNKYLKGKPLGITTDDTQLSLAVAEAIISEGRVDMKTIALAHVTALENGTIGWGGSTKEAVKRMYMGVPYTSAGITDKPNRGMGNGVAMKAAPLGVYYAMKGGEVTEHITEFTLMTHHTNMAVASGAAWAEAIRFILSEPWNYFGFCQAVFDAATWGNLRGVVRTDDDIRDRLVNMFNGPFTPEQIIAMNGGGSPYVYDSLPFALLFFLRDPHRWETVIDTLNAGGDTDTTTSMVASAIGAMHGMSIFPTNLLSRIPAVSLARDTARRMYDRLTKD